MSAKFHLPFYVNHNNDSCLDVNVFANLTLAEQLISAGQSEPIEVFYLDFSKAFDLVCRRPLIKEMAAKGSPFQDDQLDGRISKEQDI